MTTRFDTIPFVRPPSAGVSAATPLRGRRDVAVAALPLFVRLRDTLRAALRFRDRRRVLEANSPANRWGVPALFYFDARLQADLERRRSTLLAPDRYAESAARHDPAGAAAWAALPELLDDALSVLANSTEARHAARATDGLVSAAQAVRHECDAVAPLVALLNLADDDTVRVVNPQAGLGVRLHVRGLADVAELHRRLAAMIPGPRWQFFRPEALRADGTLPAGPAGAEHWLWGHEALNTLPRLDGDRTVLLDTAARPVTETESRKPNPAAGSVRVLETMTTEAVDAWVAALTGRRPARRAARSAA